MEFYNDLKVNDEKNDSETCNDDGEEDKNDSDNYVADDRKENEICSKTYDDNAKKKYDDKMANNTKGKKTYNVSA